MEEAFAVRRGLTVCGLELEGGHDRRDRPCGHEVRIDVARGVGAGAGSDDLGDHPDRLIEHHRAVARHRKARPEEVDMRLDVTRVSDDAGRDVGEDVLERDEDRLVGRSIAERVHMDLELRPPGGDDRLFLRPEVVVEGPHGHVGRCGDVVRRDGLQPSLEGETQDGLADRGSRFGLLAFAKAGALVHAGTVSQRAESCKFAGRCSVRLDQSRRSCRILPIGRVSMYQILLYVHIICAVIWVGGAFFSQLLALRVERSTDPADLPKLGRNLEYLGMRVFLPASILLFLAGAAMVAQQWGFGQTWVAVSMGLWLAVGHRRRGLHRTADEEDRRAVRSGRPDLGGGARR